MAARLGLLLRRARVTAQLTVEALADCAHANGLATSPGWSITRDQVRDEIHYIERADRTTLTDDDYRIFWSSVLKCLNNQFVNRDDYRALVSFLIMQNLPPDFDDPLISPPD